MRSWTGCLPSGAWPGACACAPGRFSGEAGDIDDPAGQGEDVFRAARDEILRCLEKSIDRLLTTLR